MNNKFVFFGFLIISFMIEIRICIAQCDEKRFNELIIEGDRYMQGQDPNYRKAMNAYSAAMTACKDKMLDAQKKINSVFEAIDQLRNRAEIARQQAIDAERIALNALALAESEKTKKDRADSALKIANSLISQLYFYDDKYALTLKKNKISNEYMYGFIDRQGNTFIEFNFQDATPFNENTGLALVKIKRISYLLDTNKTLYQLNINDKDLNNSFPALDLSNRKLLEIPEAVFQNENLKILLFNGNSLAQNQKNIKNLPQSLFLLDLSSNKISFVTPAINYLKNLRILDLSKNQIKEFPNGIGNLVNLTSLRLGTNNLSSVPAEIGNLKNLNALDLYNNTLNTLPAEIGFLTKLEKLVLTRNHFHSLPIEIKNLINLEKLYLSNNPLYDLPPAIWNLRNLTILQLDQDSLAFVSSEIGNLMKLTELSLNGNRISTLPNEICNLENLTYLFLDQNQLTSLPPEMSRLEKLEVLSLKGNKFSDAEKERVNQMLPKCRVIW